MKNRFRFSINVKLVILALLIVFLVFRPVSSRQVSDTVQYDFSSYFTCQDGTFRGSCSGQRYCGTEELIVNNGFETVQNGNPFGFTKHGTDVSHVNDPTEAYQGNYYSISTGKYSSFAQDIKLKTRQDYSFVAYIKGDCDYVALYYTDGDGVNHNFNYEVRGYYWYWKAQPEWRPVTMDFFLSQNRWFDVKLDDFRLECAEDKTLMVDSMHLEKSDEDQVSKLIDNCGFCGCGGSCDIKGICKEEIPGPVPKLSTMPRMLTQALETKNCELIDNDVNIRNYCYDQLRQCDSIADPAKKAFCEDRKDFFEVTLPFTESFDVGSITYKAFRCKEIEILRVGAGPDICETDIRLCPARCKSRNRGLDDLGTSFQEFIAKDYEKVQSKDIISTGKDYDNYQVFAQDMLYVFEAPAGINKLQFELTTFPVGSYPLAATDISTVSHETILSTTDMSMHVPPSFPAEPSYGTILEFSVQVEDSKAAFYVSGSVNQIKVIGVG